MSDQNDNEWVQEQIEWNESNISGAYLLPVLEKMDGDLIGCEVGVCLGVTSELYAKSLPNLKKLYSVDSYESFIDWNGFVLSDNRQNLIKENAYGRLKDFHNVELVYTRSKEFSMTLDDNSLDFIFIDGDHSYNGVLSDLQLFLPKMKSGGLFAGHDVYLKGVQDALRTFFSDRVEEIKVVDNIWYIFV